MGPRDLCVSGVSPTCDPLPLMMLDRNQACVRGHVRDLQRLIQCTCIFPRACSKGPTCPHRRWPCPHRSQEVLVARHRAVASGDMTSDNRTGLQKGGALSTSLEPRRPRLVPVYPNLRTANLTCT